ncbi:MAG: hypothetical protein AAFP77_31615 [Bacteroidota bacterium]
MSTDKVAVKDLKAYGEGFNRGAYLANTHKKLTSVQASFIRSLLSRDYSQSYMQGIYDGWQSSFERLRQKLKDQAIDSPSFQRAKRAPEEIEALREQERQSRAARMQQMTQQREMDGPDMDR